VSEDRMLKWFSYDHLPENLREKSKLFHELAMYICDHVESSPERTVGLRKLLEAKDCIVRATLHPGG